MISRPARDGFYHYSKRIPFGMKTACAFASWVSVELAAILLSYCEKCTVYINDIGLVHVSEVPGYGDMSIVLRVLCDLGLPASVEKHK